MKDVPHALCAYGTHYNILIAEEGIILCGEPLLIPHLEREEMFSSIHEDHQDITKCWPHTIHFVYRPNVNTDIKHVFESFETCQDFRQQKVYFVAILLTS